MAIQETTQFHATVEGLEKILTWVQKKIEAAPLSAKQAMHFELALEEAIVNVIMHAYSQQGGVLQIDVKLTKDALTFTLTDQGTPFDPVTAPLKEEVAVEEMVPGGLGVKFMRLYCDDLIYQRQDHGNQLILSKKIISSSQ